LDHLTAQLPATRGLRRLKSRISFGHVLLDADQGTLGSLGPAPKEGERVRPLANPELFGVLSLAKPMQAAAARTFPTFQAYMDMALHDPKWGYYGHNVVIGRGGHFITNPESLSPHYGRWLAAWAFKVWKDMLAHGELTESDVFPLIELGAGNGRLARDILDAIARAAAQPEGAEHAAWQTFAARVTYRIYEMSESLREKQRLLLGTDAVVTEGDARQPEATLKRDFPSGVKGFILSNEVPDAFGVHKVVLTPEGRAFAALVVPRVEPSLCDVLEQSLVAAISAANSQVRQTFGFAGNEGDFYLDGASYASVMEALLAFPAGRRESLLATALWFEEAYVPVSAIPELAAHLRANATQYATALAAEDSGVVLYVNVHADRFIRELGASLSAGVIVTIDYGDTTWRLVQGSRRAEFPFRVYGDSYEFDPRPNDPYSLPGTQDMTADVSFTELARAGEAAGLSVLHFGPERDLIGAELPEVLAAAGEQEALHELVGNPVFKVLVLGTRASDVFTGPLLSRLPLACREQDLAKARRHRIPSILQTLVSLER
jgi:SAM-dependent MidA family methyltransferase